jgi:hypothetical protein
LEGGVKPALFFWGSKRQSAQMRRFTSFTCIDWSGAIGAHPPGLAVASIGSENAPALVHPMQQRWSRAAVRDWLLQLAETQADMLIGLDLSLGFPFIDQDAFFPEWEMSPTDARGLWALVETLSAGEPHLGANAFLAHPEARRHFRHAKGDVGNLFLPGIGRLREVERHQRATRQANSWSCFNLVGAGQVGKSSLTGMRMIHQLQGRIPIWPFDPLPETGPVIVEIYTSMAARAAGLPANRSKVRDIETLAKALGALSAGLPQRLDRMDDHATDALITAAWMRRASADPLLWSPAMMNDRIRQTEGWTFGVV